MLQRTLLYQMGQDFLGNQYASRFPKQEDFVPPPPLDETSVEKMERISASIKVRRNRNEVYAIKILYVQEAVTHF